MEYEIIYSYSRKQAIEDGVLINLNEYILVKESGFKYPIACTSVVWGIIQEAVNNKKYLNDHKGVIWDIFSMLRYYANQSKNDTITFTVIITGTGRKKYHIFKAICGPGDDRKPVITIMLPGED